MARRRRVRRGSGHRRAPARRRFDRLSDRRGDRPVTETTAQATRISREKLAARIAQDIPEGSYVNLGIGAPTLVADYLPQDQEIILHT
ncbi:MAG TPA: CoA-transferase, partial [Microbacterium sp.]|nr:CoA-transferase [Microbacterium sp.]